MNITQPKIKITLENWVLFCKNLKYGDIIFIFCDDISGDAIEWASADDQTPDPLKIVSFLHPAHVFRYYGLGRGATIEASPAGSAWHIIDEYRDRAIAGDVRLIVFRHNDLTVADFEKIKTEGERQVGKPYGWGAILSYGFYGLVRETFIGAIIRAAKWQTPFCDRNAPVCSQGVRLQEDTIKRFYDTLIKLSAWQDNTPQKLLNEIDSVAIYTLDSFRGA